MEASEMLDVIHYLFEEDILPKWEHDSDIKDRVRKTLYDTMYNKTYKYGSSQNNSAPNMVGEDDSGELPDLYAEPMDGSVKPFFPASSMEELSGIVGTPMGE